jgi:anhydro-N-acetylmuramic acid kinase
VLLKSFDKKDDVMPNMALGLMSGTSMDGIDAAIIETDGYTHIQEIGHTSIPYPPFIRQLFKSAEALVRQHQGNLEEVRKGDFEDALKHYLQTYLSCSEADIATQVNLIKKHLGLGRGKPTFERVIALSTELHAEAVAKILKKCKLTPGQINVVGYHGQTLFHNPKEGITIQVGDAHHLASRTGISIVNDFRTQDVQAGGQGAPFAPLYHQALAVRDGKIPLAVVNCGGISNITVIKDDNPKSLVGFDPGPGNSLVDRFVQGRTQGKEAMDTDGHYGREGQVNLSVLEALREKAVWKNGENYLLQPPPKALDVGDLFLIPELDGLSLEDGCATLEAFTADAIVRALEYIDPPYPKHWILAGGGWYNPLIKQELTRQLKEKLGQEIHIQTADEAGWNGDALEAQIFAYLAVRHLKGLPTSYPQTTGVPKPIVGGQFTPKTGK